MPAPRRAVRQAHRNHLDPLVDARTLPRMAERGFQNQVLSLAAILGWGLQYHPPAGGKAGRVDVEQRGSGFPDVTLLHGRHDWLLFAELKIGRAGTVAGDPRLDQIAWLERLDRIDQRYGDPERAVAAYLWRPDDLPMIQAVLQGGPGVGISFTSTSSA